MTTEESWSFIRTIDAGYILVPLFIVYLVIVMLKLKRQGKSYNIFQYITLISLGVYVLSVVALTTFPIEVNWGMYKNQTPWYSRINPIPILTIDMTTFILNIIMLVPFGVYQWLLVKQEKISWELVAVRSLLFSLGIEVLQLLLYIITNSARSVDVNDLIANTLGGVLGYYGVKFVSKNTYFKECLNQFKVSMKSHIIKN
ncbi:VanZ family protein [Sporosarcina aquimarina]|uniref:VanZ family protein n=1 Tax=Sporosarcina aquimarina TaxID=114975 RepID=A0ABU4G2L9_9BACL|nr:VanZ family protein [Sporosarcina aquimarina]MDW0111222.1 VanZ family protein [Sporosarcina aquimarina]